MSQNTDPFSTPRGALSPEGVSARVPSILDDTIEGSLQRNDALCVLHLALASNGYDLPITTVASILRDIEEGGYTLRLTTHAERLGRNDETGPSR